MSIRSLDRLEIRRARATFEPSTLDRENRTVEAVIATDSPVPMPGRIERLSMVPDAVALPTRMVLLDAHNQGSIGNILGYADNFRFEGGRLLATLHVRDDRAFELIADGILTGLSIGYRVQKFTDRREAGTGQLVRTVTRFAIVECSLVAVPADANATIRSHPVEENEVIEPGQQEIISDPPENETRAEVNAQIRSIAQTAGLGDDFANRMIDEGRDLLHTRAAAFDAMQRRSEAPNPIRGLRLPAFVDSLPS